MAKSTDTDSIQREVAIKRILEEKGELYRRQPDFYEEASRMGFTLEELLYEKASITYQVRTAIEQMENEDIFSTYNIGNNDQVLWAEVPLIQQPNNYTCGPTSVL